MDDTLSVAAGQPDDMFTGIVEEVGEVVSIEEAAAGRQLRVAASFAGALDHGASIAVNGACLTVETTDADSFACFCSEETLDRTYFDELHVGDGVNLERPLVATARIDGHFVQGHVDGVGTITDISPVTPDQSIETAGNPETDPQDWLFQFSVPRELSRYIVEKGSVAVDGISLTVADLQTNEFTVAVIPTTYDLTTMAAKSVGDPVHLEVDILAKYVERLLEESP